MQVYRGDVTDSGVIQALVEAAIEWGFAAGIAQAFEWYDWLESARSVVRYEDKETGLLRRHAALAGARPSVEAEKRWRDLISSQTNDLALYRVLNALATKNSTWLLDEARKELEIGSPRGRALALVLASAVDDDGEALTAIAQGVDGAHKSWYQELTKMAWQYVSRGRDQRHWVNEALFSDDPCIRTRGAVLFEHLGHPRFVHELNKVLASEQGQRADQSRVARLPPYNGHRRESSEWAKNMAKRLLGSRSLEHAAAPWLPDAVA